MIKTKAFGLVAVALFAAASVYAGDKACCVKQAKNESKMECASFANLNLDASQKTKLEGFQAKCQKTGCTKESMAEFMKSAEGVLSKEQFATLKSECNKMHAGAKA